jgi:phytoene dehydrogenase-like protein
MNNSKSKNRDEKCHHHQHRHGRVDYRRLPFPRRAEGGRVRAAHPARRHTLDMWFSHFDVTWAPAGGMQAFANPLVRFIHQHGGEVHLGMPVERIRVE